MASDYLIKTVKGYENYIERKGIDEQVLDAYILAVQTAFEQEKDIKYRKSLRVNQRVMKVPLLAIEHWSSGGTIYMVKCNNPDCPVPATSYPTGYNLNEVIAEWNGRADNGKTD